MTSSVFDGSGHGSDTSSELQLALDLLAHGGSAARLMLLAAGCGGEYARQITHAIASAESSVREVGEAAAFEAAARLLPSCWTDAAIGKEGGSASRGDAPEHNVPSSQEIGQQGQGVGATLLEAAGAVIRAVEGRRAASAAALRAEREAHNAAAEAGEGVDQQLALSIAEEIAASINLRRLMHVSV